MTVSRHYDVVVIGAEIGALAAAALLARRSWRVLVLGHGWRRPNYTYDGMTLARRPFTFLSASSPAWGRVLVELAQSQTFRRRLVSLDPMLQVLTPSARLELPPDTELFGREIEREFPAIRRIVDDLYTEFARTNAIADAAFERDAVWPPGGFWERRETASILSTLPHLETGSTSIDLLADFSREHPFRDVVSVPATFATDLADPLPPFALARLHGAWTRGMSCLPGGEDDLVDFLLDRIRAHGGEIRLNDRAASIVHKGGKVRGVCVDGDELPVGVTFVVSDETAASVLDLAPDFVASNEARAVLTVPETRFVMSLVVRPEGVPGPLAVESFLLPEHGRPVHLQKVHDSATGNLLLVAEAILSVDAPRTRIREETLATLYEFLPFVERHILVCDSPHDGRPLWDFRAPVSGDPLVGPASARREASMIERVRLRAAGGSLEPEAEVPRFSVMPRQLHGLAGDPLRAPLGNVFVAGRSALPALGQEGQLLAAWGVARIITRTDRRREKMLREMWTKVELS